jgi:hypothetical protein
LSSENAHFTIRLLSFYVLNNITVNLAGYILIFISSMVVLAEPAIIPLGYRFASIERPYVFARRDFSTSYPLV